MNLTITINKLRGGKNFKLPYFLGQICRWATPKALLQRRLGKLLRDYERRYDMTYVLDRVNYYNRLDGTELLDTTATSLGEFGLKNNHSTFFFDAYQTTRWFGDSLRWDYFFGDGVKDPSHPLVIKVRMIDGFGGGTKNSVLLNLDRSRYDIVLDDRKPFTEKLDKVVFRGSVKGSPLRQLFIDRFCDNQRVDTADTRSGHSSQETGTARHISLYAHLDYKYIMALEGNDMASNLRWIMSTNSIAVMPRLRIESWFMEGRLIPGYHYIEVKPDFSDLEEKMNYYTEHPDEAQAIIDHANEHARQFQDRGREQFISLLVMKKYFEKTGQLDNKKS